MSADDSLTVESLTRPQLYRPTPINFGHSLSAALQTFKSPFSPYLGSCAPYGPGIATDIQFWTHGSNPTNWVPMILIYSDRRKGPEKGTAIIMLALNGKYQNRAYYLNCHFNKSTSIVKISISKSTFIIFIRQINFKYTLNFSRTAHFLNSGTAHSSFFFTPSPFKTLTDSGDSGVDACRIPIGLTSSA